MPRLAPAIAVPEPEMAGAYFLQRSTELEFLSSGCCLLDCVLGGGYVFGRMSNIIGDKSTAKTGLAMEAAAQFDIAFPDPHDRIYYRESEGAFDDGYGGAMGMPVDRVHFWKDDYPDRPFETIEDMFEDLELILDDPAQRDYHSLYIVDSLDALSDRAEMARKIDEGSYSLEKQKKLGQLFRRLVRKIEASRMCLIIISQVRDNIGVTFGEKHKRTGGKAMDFYATHCLWLSHTGQIHKTVKKVKRAIGIQITAKCKKNKVGLPFRDCDMEYMFGFGLDDLGASLDWLTQIGRLDALGLDAKSAPVFLKEIELLPRPDYDLAISEVSDVVRNVWADIDREFLPMRRKYGG